MTDKRHPTYLLMNGNLVAYDDARVHVLSTAFKYGATVFEGLRAYWSEEKQELYGFRLREHFQRLVEIAADLPDGVAADRRGVHGRPVCA